MGLFDALPSSSAAPSAPSSAGLFGGIQSGTPTTAPSSGGIFANIKPVPAVPVSSTPSYFATTTKSGASFGPSLTLDPSGKPLLDYREPGDTSTTTDKTRVDTTFDPTVPAPHPQSEIATPRVVSPEEKAQIKAKVGAPSSDVIDHAMALTVAGSNEPENLRPETNDLNSQQGTFEEDLDQQVRDGKISLFDAQKLEAANKGLPEPYTGAQAPSFWDKVKGYLDDAVNNTKAFFGETAHADTTGQNVNTDDEQNSVQYNPDLFTPQPTPAQQQNKSSLNFSVVPNGKTLPGATPQKEDPFNPTVSKLPSPDIKVPFAQNNFNTGLAGPLGGAVKAAVELPERVTQEISDILHQAFTGSVSDKAVFQNGDQKVSDSFSEAGDMYNQMISSGSNDVYARAVSTMYGVSGLILDLAPIVSGAAKLTLAATQYNAPLEESLARIGMNKGNFTVEDWARNTQAAADNLKATGDMQGLRQLIQDYKTIGNNLVAGTPRASGAAKFIQDIAARIEAPLGGQAAFDVSKAGEESLPGYRARPGQSPAFGLSTEEREPVGFGEKSAPSAPKTGVQTLPLDSIKPEVRYPALGMGPEPIDPSEFESIKQDNPDLVKAIQDGKQIDPIPVEATADGQYRLLGDGGNRYAAYKAAGVSNIPVDVKNVDEFKAPELKSGDVVNTVLKGKTDMPEAFSNPEIGKIDGVYGKPTVGSQPGFGLAKIESDHPEVLGKISSELPQAKVTQRLPQRTILETQGTNPMRFVVDHQLGNQPKTFLNNAYNLKNVPRVGVEPTTSRASNESSTIELPRQNNQSNSSIHEDGKPVNKLQKNGAQSKLLGGIKVPESELRKAVFEDIPEKDIKLYFRKDYIRNLATGQFTSSYIDAVGSHVKPMIELYTKHGMGTLSTAYHEAAHYLINEVLTPIERAQLLKIAKETMTASDRAKYFVNGYLPSEHAEEFAADQWAKTKQEEWKTKNDYKGPWQKIFEKLDAAIKKIIAQAKKIFENIKNIPNQQGGFIKNPFGEESEEEIRPSTEETDKGIVEQDETPPKAKTPTPLEQSLNELKVQKEALQQTVDNHPAKHLSQYVNPRTGELPEALGTGRSKFGLVGDELANNLGFKSSEEARTGYLDYKLQQKRLNIVKQDIANTRKAIADAKLEDRDAKSIKSLLDKNTKLTDIDIKKQLHMEAVRKAAAEAAKNIADAEKYRTELEARIKGAMKGAKDEGVMKGIARALNPIKHFEPGTKTAVETWLTHRTMADILANEEFKKYPGHALEGMNTIIAQQDGAKIPWLTKTFDDLRDEGNKRGLDIPYQENYVPQVWKESPEEISEVVKKRMLAQGLDETVIDSYLKGETDLDSKTAARLKLNPSFTKEKTIPDYRTGISMGLHPKYPNPVQLIANYRREMEQAIANRNLAINLKKEGVLLPTDLNEKPAHWDVTTVFGKSYWAPDPLAKFLNDYLRNEDDLTWQQKLSRGMAHASLALQNIALMSGFPGTTIQAFPVALLYSELLGYGNFKAIKPFILSNSSKLTTNWIESNWKYIRMMAEDGVPIGSLANGEWNKESLAKIFKDTNLLDIGDLKSLAGNIFDRGWQSKVYDRLMPMLATEMYKGIYNKNIGKLGESAARTFAAKSIQNKYVFPAVQGRTTQQVTRSIFYGPVWRQQIVKTLINSAKGYSTEFRNPTFRANRALLVGLLATFAAYQIINKQKSGHYTWENAAGHEMDIDLPQADGSHSYVTFFPSYMTLPRIIVGAGDSLVHGDVLKATETGVQALNPILQLITEMMTNTNYYGNPIYKPNDTPSQKYIKLAEYVGSSVIPTFIKDSIGYVSGTDTKLQVLSSMTGGIVKYLSAKGVEQSTFYNAANATSAQHAADVARMQPTFARVQQLLKDGRTSEAEAITSAMSPADYAIYKSMKTTAKATQTKNEEVGMTATVQQVQELLKEGNMAAASKITQSMTPEEYKAYTLAKKKMGIK